MEPLDDKPPGLRVLAGAWSDNMSDGYTLDNFIDLMKDMRLEPKAIGFKATFTINYTTKKDLKRQLAQSGLLTKSISKKSRIRMKLALKYGGFFK